MHRIIKFFLYFCEFQLFSFISMTIIQLEYVLAVAESKNFTLAAKKAYVTQPTLSMQIQKLESELGVDIFDRSTHPIRVTKIGEKILAQAKTILNEVQRMPAIVNEEKTNLSGDFRLGVIPTVLPTLVPLFYKIFNKKFKHANLIMQEMKTEEILISLRENTIDFGIAVTPLLQPDMVEELLYYEPMLAFVPEGHRLSQRKNISEEDLDIRDLILLEEGHCFRNNVLSICHHFQQQEEKSLMIESGSFQTLIKLAKDGFGMTVLPALAVNDLKMEDKNFIKPFKNPVPTREVSLIYHNSQLRMSFAKELKNLIRSVLRGMIFLESERNTLPYLNK